MSACNEETHRALLSETENFARLSRDPSTKVGAILTTETGQQLAFGCNRFPVSIAETPERLNNRDIKNDLIIHAEMDALRDALLYRRGLNVPHTLYVVALNPSGEIWGGPPCIRCTVHLIHAGIRRIVTYPFKNVPSRWTEQIEKSYVILAEANIELVTLKNN